jgi:hypothetical protein
VFSVKLPVPEAKSVTETRDPKAGDRSDHAPSETRPDHTRLAHWPPPFRSRENGPKRTIKQVRGEVPHRATGRGWRMTRAVFSEYDEE